MKTFVVKNDWLNFVEHGWGNGYVAVPPTSSLHGLNYEDVDVNVHGGLTYSSIASEFTRLPKDIPDDWWIFGFDTAHGLDNQTDQNLQYVLDETESLLNQLIELDGVTK